MITECSVSPVLPAGLTMDSAIGTISGTPIAPLPTTRSTRSPALMVRGAPPSDLSSRSRTYDR
ncbi:putative Ig domain-containing protein [Cupriavidus sp. IDO]|uniref:putative Ig domain-containing protein n=1 Tax=Cupriavidus sp. IDO TaxID=1539142 RepID=UPI003FCE753C